MKDQYVAVPRSPRPDVKDSDVKEVKDIIKSCIIARKGGMPLISLRDDYSAITDSDIPYFKLGYVSLFHLLRDIPEIKSTRNASGEPVLIVEQNPKTKHLQEMIQKQKDPKTYMRVPRKNSERKLDYKIRQDKRRYAVQDEKRNLSSETVETEGSAVKSKVQPPVDELWGKPVIKEVYDFENRRSTCTDPIVGCSQLIGDDYFLQLAIKYELGPLVRKDRKSAITCGTVQSGLTIRKAIDKLAKIKIMSNKLIINVGTVDLYNRRNDGELKRDYRLLLNKLRDKYGYSNHQITLCTLPPMGNVGVFCQSNVFTSHAFFNVWLRDFALDEGYNLLDLQQEFTDEQFNIDFQYFQQDARMVSGTIHPHVLWNYWGRQKAMKLLLNAGNDSLTGA